MKKQPARHTSGMAAPADIVADTRLTPDPTVAGRFHADIPEAWKIMYTFGGVTMFTALRAIREALARPELDLVTANAIYLAPSRRVRSPSTCRCCATDGVRRRSRRTCGSRVTTRSRCGPTACSAWRTTSSTDCRRSCSRRCPDHTRYRTRRRLPKKADPGARRSTSTTRRSGARSVDIRRGIRTSVRAPRACPGVDALAPRGAPAGRLARSARARGARRRDRARGRRRARTDRNAVHGALARDRDPFRRDAVDSVGAAGDRSVARRRRLRDRTARLWDERGRLCAIATQTAHLRVFDP